MGKGEWGWGGAINRHVFKPVTTCINHNCCFHETFFWEGTWQPYTTCLLGQERKREECICQLLPPVETFGPQTWVPPLFYCTYMSTMQVMKHFMCQVKREAPFPWWWWVAGLEGKHCGGQAWVKVAGAHTKLVCSGHWGRNQWPSERPKRFWRCLCSIWFRKCPSSYY